MGKKRKEETISFDQMVNTIEGFMEEIGLDEGNYEMFARGMWFLLLHLPVKQFRDPKPTKRKKRSGNVVPFRRA